MKLLTDQLGNQHIFETVPKRIVSLVPSQTELLCDLGLEDAIVGITKFCVHPFHLKSTKTIVGGTKNVKYDKIKALQPDIIICNKEESTQEIVVQLQSICPVWVTDIYTISDNNKMICDFGEIFNKRVEAQNWIDKINFAYHDFQQYVKDKKEIKVAYFIWAKPYMIAANNTFINLLLMVNKFKNVYAHLNRYPEVEAEKFLSYNPDFILLSSEPFPFKEEHVFEMHSYINTAKFAFVDGEMFSWYGSRLVKAFSYFKTLREKMV